MSIERSTTTESVTTLTDLVETAREMLNRLRGALEPFKNTGVLQNDLGMEDGDPSTGHEESMKGLMQVTEYYNKICDERIPKVKALSGQDHGSRFPNTIKYLAADMVACQGTFPDGLAFIYMITLSGADVEPDNLVAGLTQSVDKLKSKISGLDLAIDLHPSSSPTDTSQDAEEYLKLLREHRNTLDLCLRFYEPAITELSCLTNIEVKYMYASGQAKVARGNFGTIGQGQPIQVESAVARGESRMFTGNMSAEAAEAFWK
ncbi:hypothetical protein F5883DRAFT_145615 [Diaporthe sp. PMI_573]|nr:hypothetical protein F5883DRAFT_145615 [Diaporthaceae sp. PMI_573]